MKIIIPFIKKIRDSREKKILVENFFSLSFLQTANYILPLVTIPYLVRVLGTDKYGLITFAQTLIQYFVLFVNYGFDMSITRDVSTNRENRDKILEIFSCVMVIKIIFMAACFFIMACMVFAIPKFRDNWLLYLFTFGITLGNVLFPVWLFQGMEKMKYIAIINVFSRLLFTILIFACITHASQYIYVALINSLSFIIAGLLALVISIRIFNISIIAISLNKVIFYIKDAFGLFLSKLSSRGYSITNIFLVGIFFNNTFVAYYAIADKIISTVISLWQPLVQTIYPYLSKDFRPSFFRKIFRLSFLASIGISLMIYLSSKIISIVIYGTSVELFRNVLNYLTVLIPISICYMMFGAPLLLALGFKKEFANSFIYGYAIHLILLFICFSFFKISLPALASILIISKLCALLIMIFYVYKKGHMAYVL